MRFFVVKKCGVFERHDYLFIWSNMELNIKVSHNISGVKDVTIKIQICRGLDFVKGKIILLETVMDWNLSKAESIDV